LGGIHIFMDAQHKSGLKPSKLAEILRATLEDVEQEPGLDQRHPTVVEFKQLVRDSITELERSWGRAA